MAKTLSILTSQGTSEEPVKGPTLGFQTEVVSTVEGNALLSFRHTFLCNPLECVPRKSCMQRWHLAKLTAHRDLENFLPAP